jgi:hypothetical protein
MTPFSAPTGFGAGQAVVQGEQPAPGELVDAEHGEVAPDLAGRQSVEGQVGQAGVLPAADEVLDTGVHPMAGLGFLDVQRQGGGVGGGGLVAPPGGLLEV